MKKINTRLIEDIDIESTSANAEKKSYEQKLKKCSGRVYKYNYSEKPRSTKKLERTIDRDVENPKFDMNEDVDSIILATVNYFWLPPYMADRTKFIMYDMWSYPDNFHGIKYENALLGILMYISSSELSEEFTVDFSSFCIELFGPAQDKIMQMYKASEIVRDLYRIE